MLGGDAAPLPQKGAEPPSQFLAHVCCGQTSGWIKMALGMEVGLDPGHIMLDGDPAVLPKKGGRAPSFWPIFIVAACIKIPLGMEVGLSPRDCVFDGDPAPSAKRGRSPEFSAHVYCGQTAA